MVTHPKKVPYLLNLSCVFAQVSPRAGAMGDWTKRLPMTPRQHDFRQGQVRVFPFGHNLDAQQWIY